jgi:hypothetical protein
VADQCERFWIGVLDECERRNVDAISGSADGARKQFCGYERIEQRGGLLPPAQTVKRAKILDENANFWYMSEAQKERKGCERSI